jgi:hypothetical protein
MNTGLTIAFICNGNDHPTIINYKKFGNQFWDDTQNNNSKIGYYFAYYFQQKCVYIHKIINILQPSERPSSMIWASNRQILCLSKQLKKFTWNEWITGIGIGAPYTPNYRMTQTGSWSYNELQNHKKYNTFNFINFKNVIENQPTTITTPLPIYEEKYEYEDAVEEEDESDDEEEIIAKQKAEMEAFIKTKQFEMERLITEKRIRKMKANPQPLRDEAIDKITIRIKERQQQIDALRSEQYKDEQEIYTISQGGRDEELITNVTKQIKLNVEY